jgi:hypothetical protein
MPTKDKDYHMLPPASQYRYTGALDKYSKLLLIVKTDAVRALGAAVVRRRGAGVPEGEEGHARRGL